MADKSGIRYFRARMARGTYDDDEDSLFGFSQDVTREVTARQKAQDRNIELEALIEALPEAVLLLENGRVVLANLAARSLLGDSVTPHAPFLALVESSHRAEFARHARTGASTLPATFPLDIPGNRFVEVFSADLPSRSSMRVVTLRDVTDRRASELRVAAGDRLASVGRLAAGVAHEINNPLTYVALNLEMLSEDIETLRPKTERSQYEGFKQKLTDALTGTKRVAEIVQQLRLFAHQGYETKAVGRLEDAAAVAIQLASFAIPSSVQIEVNLPLDLPPVAISVGPLSQIIMNLCVNAGDAIEESGQFGGIVKISANKEGDGVRMFVQDNGPGVPEKLHQTIFQPFFTTKEPGKGTGMGLSIIRRLIHEAGGTLSLGNVPNGACFEVYLPLAKSVELLEESQAVEASPLAARRTLLVIEDEPALRRALAARLRGPFDVQTAADGREARVLIEGGLVPHAILCDVEMPRMDGPSFLDWLQADAPELVPRVVIMTGGTLDPIRAARLQEAGRPVVAKPLHMPSLQDKLTEVSTSPVSEEGPDTEQSPAERRRAPRVAARGIRAVLDLGEEVHSAEVVDMSASGLRLRNGILPKHALSNTPIRVLLMGKDGEPVSLSVRSVWTRERSEDSMEYGFAREPFNAPVPVVLARWIDCARRAPAA
ncbi:MAG: ATP-binding protein [Myxococcota bacterium]|nr:ATP-binding protein [Myxococcota bacterium]